MNGFNAYEMMTLICQNALRKQVRKAVDYIGENGLLICGVCGKPRQTYLEVPNPDKDHLAKLLTATTCDCEKEQERKEAERKLAMDNHDRIMKYRGLSLLDEKFKNVSFDILQRTKFNEKNLKLCVRYAERFNEMRDKNQGMIFWGDVGTGKSYAAAAIANYLLGKVVPVIMVSFVEILKNIESKKMTQDEIITLVNSAQLVIFDDLGAERSSDFAVEKIYSIVDARYRRKLPMIVTTNLTMEQMKEETDTRYQRIYDRIFEICYPMQFTGPSWRRVEGNKRYVAMESLLAD